MTQSFSPKQEPTLQDVLNKIEGLSEDVEQSIEGLSQDLELSNERFENYQKAVQWVVQLAFTLIASATLTVIVSAVLK